MSILLPESVLKESSGEPDIQASILVQINTGFIAQNTADRKALEQVFAEINGRSSKTFM